MIVNTNLIIQCVIPVKNGTIKCQRECQYFTCKKYCSWNSSTLWEWYLESIADTSVIVYDEIINATDGVSTNMTNATPTNMTNTNLINVMSTMCQYTLMIKMQDIKWIFMFCTQYYTNKYDKCYINKCISAQKKTY